MQKRESDYICNERAREIRDRRYRGEINDRQALMSLSALVGEYRPKAPHGHTREDTAQDNMAVARAFLAPDVRELD